MKLLLSKRKAFRISCYSLGMAVLTVIGVPVGCAITAADNVTWDYWSNDFAFLWASIVLLIVFLLASLFSGLYAIRQYRIAALWVLPLSAGLIAAIGGGVYALYIYIFDPFGM